MNCSGHTKRHRPTQTYTDQHRPTQTTLKHTDQKIFHKISLFTIHRPTQTSRKNPLETFENTQTYTDLHRPLKWTI